MKADVIHLLDFERINSLLEGFNKATGFVTAILDLEGNILSKSGWRRICTDFHRVNSQTAHRCTASDTNMANSIAADRKFHYYQCLNGLIDVAVPLVIQGEHIANLFTGQFFFNPPEREEFIKQAQTYGFDKTKYLEALDEVPIFTREAVSTAVDFLLEMTSIIAEMTRQRLELTQLNESIQKSQQHLTERNEELFKAQESTEQSRIYLDNILNAVGDPVFVKDDQSRVLLVNDAFCQLFDMPREDVLWKTLAEEVKPEEREHFLAIDRQVLANGRESTTIETITIRNRPTRTISTRKTRFTDSNGQRFLVGIMRDITEQKKTEDELLHREALLNKIFDVLPVGLWLADRNGKLLRSNARGREIWGAEPLVGPEKYGVFKARALPSGKELAPEDWALAHSIRDGVTVMDEMLEINAFDGSKKTILNYTAPIHDATGNIDGAIIVNLDITQTHKAEQALKESEEKHRLLLQNLHAGVVVHAADSSILYANDMASELLGLSADQMMGRTSFDPGWHFKKEDLTPLAVEEYPAQLVLSTKAPLHEKTYGIHRPVTSDLVWVLVNAFPEFKPDGSLRQVVVTFIDITKRKLAEEKLYAEALERQRTEQELHRIEWLLSSRPNDHEGQYIPPYGDLVPTDPDGQIRNTVGETMLSDIVGDYLDLLNTSAAVYEKNGDYALGIFSSGWCRHMDAASRQLCDTDDNREALECGKWLCHESCWSNASKTAIGTGQPVDIECEGGLRLYAVPVYAGNEVVGAINFGYGDPPSDPETLKILANKYKVSIEELQMLAGAYESRPPFIIDLAKKRLHSSARLISEIIERKQTEVSLRESEERFKALHNASFGGIAIHDQGIILECNRGLAEMTGYAYNELIGMDGALLIAETSRPMVTENIISGFEEPYESIGIRKNGEEYPIRLEARTIPYKGKMVRTVEFRDITLQKQTELLLKEKSEELEIRNEELMSSNAEYAALNEEYSQQNEELLKAMEEAAESEAKFREMADLLPQIVYECDLAGNLNFVNKHAYTLTGYSAEDSLIGKSTIDFYIPADRQRAIENIKLSLHGPKKAPSNEYTMIRKDGSTFNVLVYSTPILKNKKPLGLRGIIVDVSEMKQTQKELIEAKEHAEKSDRLKSAFLANMSHEIRTPMNGILGFAELLKEPGLSGERQKDYIQIIEKSGVRMLNIINDIINISKIESGLITVDLMETNINEQIEFIYTFFKPEVEGKGIQLSFSLSLPASEAILKTDREKVYAVLTNLVKNAIKFTQQGVIHFGYVTKPGFMEFFVEDTGIGIPEQRQHAIFERFIQASIDDKNAYQGAGLGLSISKAYIEMLGGKLWVESEEGKGSTFYFTLPYPSKEKPQKATSTKNAANH